jgi:uncharacterized protein DUF4013
MTTGFSTQSLQDLLVFPFRAPNARSKLLIAGLLGFAGFIIPIIPGLLLLGYGGLIMRRIIKEKGEPYLPEWENVSEMLVLGLRMGAAFFVYSVPVLLILMLSYVSMMVPMFVDIFSHPSYGGSDYGPSLGLEFGGIFVWMCGFGIAILLATLLWLILPAVLGHVVAQDSFSAAFDVREWWRVLRANWGGFLVAMILLGGVYMAVVLVAQVLYMTIILCILLPFVFAIIGAYLTLIAAVVFAQAYAEGLAKLEAPTPAQPAHTEPSGA